MQEVRPVEEDEAETTFRQNRKTMEESSEHEIKELKDPSEKSNFHDQMYESLVLS